MTNIIVILVCSLFLIFEFATSQNVDSLASIDLKRVTIFENLSGQKQNPNYFGLSLNLARGNSIFIAAPKSNISFPRYFEPGAIFRCQLGQSLRQTPQGRICQLITFPENQQCLQNKKSLEGFSPTCESSFIGGSMTYNGVKDQLIVCAPGWSSGSKNDNAYLRLPGLCYSLEKATSSNYIQSELVPFAVDNFKSPEGDLTGYAIKETKNIRWFFSQQGFSSHVTQDQRTLIGAPGVATWNGQVLAYSQNLWEKSTALFPLLHRGVPDDLSMFGYAITSGRYFSKNEILVVAGSPTGAEMKGVVLVIQFESFKRDRNLPVCYWKFIHENFCSTETLRHIWKPFRREIGFQFGSYFGSVLESVDVNGDGLDELFVGAPFQSLKNEEVIEVKLDRGCVYIFTKGDFNFDEFKETEICGLVSGGRFGSSIAKIGDINSDNFEDVAIGAPGENAIYIYFGGNPDNEAHKLTKISATPFGLNFMAFGATISGGVDLDGNGTPDFAVGDYASQKVAIFRTRPRLKIFNDVIITLDQSSPGVQSLPNNIRQFFISLCVRPQVVAGSLSKFQILQRQTSLTIFGFFVMGDDRFKIGDRQNSNFHNSQAFSLEIEPSQERKCHQVQALRKEGEITLNEDDAENPIKMTLRLWYNQTVQNDGDFLTKYKIIQNFQSDRLNVEATGEDFQNFCPTCPSPFQMEPLVKLTVIESENCTASRDACQTFLDLDYKVESVDSFGGVVIARFKNFNHHNDSTMRLASHFLIGSAHFLKITIKIRNGPDHTATLPILEFNWHVDTTPMVEVSRLKKLSPSLNNHTLPDLYTTLDLVDFNLSRPITANKRLKPRKEVQIELLLDMRDLVAVHRTNSKLELNATASCLNLNVPPSPILFNLDYEVEAHVTLKGVDKEEEWPLNLAQFIYRFEINLIGRTTIEELRILFKFPIPNLSQNSNFSILSILPPKEYAKSCQVINGEFGNREKFNSQLNLDESLISNLIEIKDNQKIVQFNCNENDAQCLQVNCTISPLGNLRKKIWLDFIAIGNKELAGNILEMEVQAVIFEALATVQILEGQVKQDKASAVSKLKINEQEQEEIAAWIIIAAAVGGFLILILITFGLCKCGFFQRTTKDKLAALKAAAAQEDAQTNFSPGSSG